MTHHQIQSDAFDMACIVLQQRGFLKGRTWQEIRQSFISACEAVERKKEVESHDRVNCMCDACLEWRERAPYDIR